MSYKLGPSYLTPEIQIPEEKLEEVVKMLFRIPEYLFISDLKQKGDLGQIACNFLSAREELDKAFKNQDPNKKNKLKLGDIMTVLEEIALDQENNNKGSNKKEFKIKVLVDLINRTDKDEIKYLIRFLEKNLKLGISQNLYHI